MESCRSGRGTNAVDIGMVGEELMWRPSRYTHSVDGDVNEWAQQPTVDTEPPVVAGLLSVYEGREYLPELLHSLAGQTSAKVLLYYLLDDGDVTQGEMIKAAMPGAEQIEEPSRLGLPAAYMRLLYRVPQEAAFYCFVDQDDIWLPGKLERAIRALSQRDNEPALWVSRVRPFVDQRGHRRLGRTFPATLPRASWRNALVECIGPGCAMVWNRALQQAVTAQPSQNGILMHDWWLYAVASTVGSVIVEPDPLLLYRLHEANAVGIDRSLRSRVVRWKAGRSPGRASIESQAQSLMESFGLEMSPEQRTATMEIASRDRLRAFSRAVRGEVYRNRRLEYPLLCARMLVA